MLLINKVSHRRRSRSFVLAQHRFQWTPMRVLAFGVLIFLLLTFSWPYPSSATTKSGLRKTELHKAHRDTWRAASGGQHGLRVAAHAGGIGKLKSDRVAEVKEPAVRELIQGSRDYIHQDREKTTNEIMDAMVEQIMATQGKDV